MKNLLSFLYQTYKLRISYRLIQPVQIWTTAHWAELPNKWHKVENFVEANNNYNYVYSN